MDEDQVLYGLFECDSCGACCKGNLIVEADYLDVRREPRLLEMQAGRRQVTQRELEDEEKVILLACGHSCPCLGPDNRCTIYPTRPNACVGFEAGSRQCQDVRAMHGLSKLMPKLPILSNRA